MSDPIHFFLTHSTFFMSTFGKDSGRPNKVKRNTYDLSFQNNLTTKFGQLTPVFCKEVLPGDSFSIDTAFGLRFMPTAFPLQTRMRADIHFFYVRNRNLWKDWMDFIGQTDPQSTPPTINPASISGKDRLTSSIYDYFGVPTTNSGAIESYFNYLSNENFTATSDPELFVPSGSFAIDWDGVFSVGTNTLFNTWKSQFYNQTGGYGWQGERMVTIYVMLDRSLSVYPKLVTVPSVYFGVSSDSDAVKFELRQVNLCHFDYDGGSGTLTKNGYGPAFKIRETSLDTKFFHADVVADYVGKELDFECNCIALTYYCGDFVIPEYSSVGCWIYGNERDFVVDYSNDFGIVDINSLDGNPYGSIRLNALPFRAYEAIYNSFYRDDRNNPRVVNGKAMYNDYITTHEGGVDSTDYKLFFRNWEQDFLTTAVPNPQQGVAPLVGITATGRMTFEDPESGQSYSVQAKTAEDNDTIIGVDYVENVPQSVQRSLVNVASSGISINDFRNVNALQRWLETNIRRGLKYKDQIKSHFDVNVSYQELDMPEFIGGVSEPVQIQTISQTVPTGTPGDSDWNPLGSYAGNAYAIGKSKHKINHYCDEHGFIIGILSVVPVPNYSQLLPKFFIKDEPLDYFFPEFGKIGFQPIRNKEVAPVQSVADGTYNEVFGYQRPWYDYLASTDEVHGDFRLSLRDFVLNRVFDGTPKLGAEFTIIDPEQLNDVFTDQTDNDKILGQIYFQCFAKRPIPHLGISKLEADI